MARVVVEGVAIHAIWRLLGGQQEDGTCVGFRTGRLCCAWSMVAMMWKKGLAVLTVVEHGMRGCLCDRGWRVDFERRPLLHGSAIDGFPVVLVSLVPWTGPRGSGDMVVIR